MDMISFDSVPSETSAGREFTASACLSALFLGGVLLVLLFFESLGGARKGRLMIVGTGVGTDNAV
jgi:hypothetical protein